MYDWSVTRASVLGSGTEAGVGDPTPPSVNPSQLVSKDKPLKIFGVGKPVDVATLKLIEVSLVVGLPTVSWHLA